MKQKKFRKIVQYKEHSINSEEIYFNVAFVLSVAYILGVLPSINWYWRISYVLSVIVIGIIVYKIIGTERDATYEEI